ncbi:hypothetical protein ACVMGC_009498 [Bradyrhizobium barranii subsp. barranii]
MPGNVGQDQDQRGVAHLGGEPERIGRGRREFHLEASGAQVTPELLPEQRLHVGLVIDDQDVNVQLLPPGVSSAAILRGSVMMNSVNTPGSVFTSIVPPCCFTTMS